MIKRRILAALALCLAAFAVAPPTSIAAAATGPTWWRVSDGGKSVLWILGIPDGMLVQAKWSDASLRRRIGRAKQLFRPEIGKPASFSTGMMTMGTSAARQPKYSIPTHCVSAYSGDDGLYRLWHSGAGNPDRPKAQSIDDRLPPDLLARVHKLIDPCRLAAGDNGLRYAKTLELALLLDLWNWPRGDLDSPVVNLAREIAQNAKTPIKGVGVQNLWFPLFQDMAMSAYDFAPGRYSPNTSGTLWPVETVAFEPPEALQQKCLRDVLDDIDSGAMPAARQAGMEAWAKGDVEHALKRSNTVKYCLMGVQGSTDVKAFLDRQAAVYELSLDRAFDDPGESVALVEFDPLLMPDGILDHYRKLGYDITTSDGMGP